MMKIFRYTVQYALKCFGKNWPGIFCTRNYSTHFRTLGRLQRAKNKAILEFSKVKKVEHKHGPASIALMLSKITEKQIIRYNQSVIRRAFITKIWPESCYLFFMNLQL